MTPNPETIERLRALLAQITTLTTTNEIHWERQLNSAHRYARWNNNLLILGPDAPTDEKEIPRYLFITPFDSPDCIEVGSDDAELGAAVLALVRAVEAQTRNQKPVDPFGVTQELLHRLTH
ncbi:MAG: hypothetical protein ICV60_00335 [Pyrinomonadaceae bacterium]|nr:hypothetical protein [Pyrinomonadaceae bacterium]